MKVRCRDRYEALASGAAKAREQHLLSDVAGRHTKLVKRGSRELVGLCPFHSERTPSFEVNDAKGTFYCHGCGKGGDHITILVDLEGMRFHEAVGLLLGDEFPVISEEDRAKRKAEDARKTQERIALARWIWDRTVPATPETPAGVYARERGITIQLPPTVRYVLSPRWFDHETGETGRDVPAMACALQDVSGAVVGVQCVFLQDGGKRKYERLRADGTKAKAKLSFGQIVGSAVRLGPVSDHLTVCEGPEDGLTLCQELAGRSVWVTCGTALMPRLALPPEIQRVTLAGDNGQAGRDAVDAATAAYVDQGIAVDHAFPNAAFKDWNDQLRGIRA